jgi:hypothetical protein
MDQYKPIINCLNAVGTCDHVHAHLRHSIKKGLSNIHLHVDGIPKLQVPLLFSCGNCLQMQTKATMQAIPTQLSWRV